SVALLGDTLHNIADALTAVPLGIAFVIGRRAATRRYTYGYGRAEDLAGIAVVLTIAASAAVAGYESIRRLLDPQDVEHLAVVAAAGVIGFAGNELVARYRIGVGRRIGSAALVADGLHARTDGFTSLAVVLGATGVAAGFARADPIIGLVITVAILAVLRGAARDVLPPTGYRAASNSAAATAPPTSACRTASRTSPPQADDGTATAKIAKGLIADSATKIILHQAPDQIATTIEHAGLTDPQAELVGQLARGKALWKVGPHTTLVEHVVGPQEIELVDTDARMLANPDRPTAEPIAENPTAQPLADEPEVRDSLVPA
ncbi:MAG TPA: cation diffusion facilitator family transporter, partial [Acidimicrobiales bacterium]|nr:cation diffusion facilitator family transporter [Acidimicrobiales bacterium]